MLCLLCRPVAMGAGAVAVQAAVAPMAVVVSTVPLSCCHGTNHEDEKSSAFIVFLLADSTPSHVL